MVPHRFSAVYFLWAIAVAMNSSGSTQEGSDDWEVFAQTRALVAAKELHSTEESLIKAWARYIDRVQPRGVSTSTAKMFAQPFNAPTAALARTDRIARSGARGSWDLVLAEAAGILDLQSPIPNTGPSQDPALVPHLAQLAERCETAFKDVGTRSELGADMHALLETLSKTVYVHEEEAHQQLSIKAEHLDRVALLTIACELLYWSTPSAASTLENVSPGIFRGPRPEGVTGELRMAAETPYGWVLIGGRGPNHYDADVAYILDLGGDDFYSGRATRSSANVPVNLIVDRSGTDHYQASEYGGLGAGIVGVSVLVDHSGNDTYEAGRLACGAGALGVGVLVDYDGNDTYSADSFALGSAVFGVGLCLDRLGNDQMTSPLYSMGFGGPLSVGMLVDGAGDDRRVARGVYPSPYGTEGQFNAGSMGAGLGFRMLDPSLVQAAGGWGVLVDCAGDDINQVGEFGFGMGYFFGVGIVRDLAGNDSTEASRYGIATGAHFGVGIVLDDKGDDLWSAPYTAGIAGNWDLTMSFFADCVGDDTYRGGGICLGGATITSLACFMDGGGKDSYEQGGDPAFGQAGHSKDVGRGVASLGIFLDAGGAEDSYPDAAPEQVGNNSERVFERTEKSEDKIGISGRGIFVDR